MKFSDQELTKELEKIDLFLIQEGISIPGRPVKAAMEISKKYSIKLPFAEPSPGTAHELREHWSITEFIIKWFDNQYGNRLGMDIGPGKCVFILRGDPWFFDYPKVYGEITFTSSREDIVNKGGIYNVLDAINDFPKGLKESLSDQELTELLKIFYLGYSALSTLSSHTESVLIKSAIADINAAVSHAMARQTEYGLSKWSSLQATEKVLKAVIENRGKDFKKTHNLTHLIKQLNDLGINLDVDSEIDEIKCLPSIRYGETIELSTAIKAHHACLRVIQKL